METGPERKKNPYEVFSKELYELIRDELTVIFPNKIINSGYICKGDRSVSRMSFTGEEGQPLSPSDWEKLKSFTEVYFSDKIVDSESNDLNGQNTQLSFTEGDPEYDYTQTITITYIKE